MTFPHAGPGDIHTPAYTQLVRWKWQVDRRWDDLAELPWPLTLLVGSNWALATVRDAVVFFLVLGASVACLVAGTTLARYVGAVLLIGCSVVAYRFVRRHVARRESD